MSLPNYSEIARDLNIPRCRGLDEQGFRCYLGDHAAGFVAENKVHWADRTTTTRLGIRRFLVLEGMRQAEAGWWDQGESGGTDPIEPWRQLYRGLRCVPALAAQLHLQLPVRPIEKEQLRAMVVKVDRSDEEAQEAFRWSGQ